MKDNPDVVSGEGFPVGGGKAGRVINSDFQTGPTRDDLFFGFFGVPTWHFYCKAVVVFWPKKTDFQIDPTMDDLGQTLYRPFASMTCIEYKTTQYDHNGWFMGCFCFRWFGVNIPSFSASYRPHHKTVAILCNVYRSL